MIVAGFQGVTGARSPRSAAEGPTPPPWPWPPPSGPNTPRLSGSDVDGVWSADPRIVPEAVKLDTLSLDEALSLARGGAKILFEDAVRYAPAITR